MKSFDKIKLHLFVPVYNRAFITKKFINLLLKQKFRNYNLYIIDDNSNDSTVAIIEKFLELDSRIFLIKTQGNNWWGGAIAYGLEKIYKRGFIKSNDYIGFMNDDITINENVLYDLLNVLKANPKSIISPVRVNNGKIIATGSKIVNWPLAISIRPLDGNLYSNKKNQSLEEIDFIGANCTFFPSSLIKDIGYPNFHKLPHYHSDGEYFLLIKDMKLISLIILISY